MRSFEDDVLRERGESARRRESAVRSDAHDGAVNVGPAPIMARHVIALQRSAGNGAVAQLLSDEEQQTSVRDVVGKGAGQPLPASSLHQMKSSFGQDFSDVRVHSGSQAAESARSVQAKAYTVGNDIVFGEESPSLESSAGQRTLAHELTHVVQQRSGPVDGTPTSGGLSISDPSDRFEREAEHVSETIASGQTMAQGDGQGFAAPAGPSVQRMEDEESDEEPAEG